MNFYALRIWWMEHIPSKSRIAFVIEQRWKSTLYSMMVLKWHQPCIECWGSGTSMKYAQIQSCRLCAQGGDYVGPGYRSIPFLDDMNNIFYPSHKIYLLQCWFKRIIYGCSKRNPAVWHQYCSHGTCGCDNHPLTHDWVGKPLGE